MKVFCAAGQACTITASTGGAHGVEVICHSGQQCNLVAADTNQGNFYFAKLLCADGFPCDASQFAFPAGPFPLGPLTYAIVEGNTVRID
jgi:hypothetical protein